jgi:hypothetical protein
MELCLFVVFGDLHRIYDSNSKIWPIWFKLYSEDKYERFLLTSMEHSKESDPSLTRCGHHFDYSTGQTFASIK